MQSSQDFIIEEGKLMEYLGNELDVIVPEGVTDIDLEVFGGDFGRKDIVSIKLPKSLKVIAGVDREEIASYYGMFMGCSKLESVEILEGLLEIGMSAFYNCKSLKKISIPESVKKIGYHAFHNCKALSYLIVPGIPLSDLEYKEKCALGFCVSPESFSKEISWEYVKYIERYKEKLIKAAIKYGCKEALDFLEPNGTIKLEESVKPEEDLSFLSSTLSIINYLAEIDKKDRLSKVDMIIENLKFQEKTLSVTDYFIEVVEPDYEMMKLLLKKANCKALSKSSLLTRAVENNLSSFVGLYLDNAFLKNKNQYIELFKIASDNCFTDIKSMLLEFNNKHFSESNNVSVGLGMNSKITVSEMKKIWKYKKKEDGTLIITGYIGSELRVIIPETIGKDIVSEIGEFAFSSSAPRLQPRVKQIRETIKEIYIPQSIHNIAANAFDNCYNLEKLMFPNTVKEGVLWFKKLYQLNELVIPEGIEQVMFSSCECARNASAITVSIPASVTTIRDSISLINYCVHQDNKNYSSISGALLNKTGTELLQYSAELVDVYDVPKTVKVVGNASIYSPKEIRSIKFPETVERIEPYAILCHCLKDIYVEGKDTLIKDGQSEYMSNVVIHGIKGSKAEEYAIRNGNIFIEL